MKDGNQNKGQNNKNNKRGFNKYNQNDRMIGNNEPQQYSYFHNNRKHRNYPKNGKDDYNPNTNPNYRKNKKKEKLSICGK
jgi:hypothetical protein